MSKGALLPLLFCLREQFVEAANDQINSLNLALSLAMFDLLNLVAKETTEWGPDDWLVLVNMLKQIINICP